MKISLTNITTQYKIDEINLQRSKVISLTNAISKDPHNRSSHALLNLTLKRLEVLMTA